MNLSDPTFQLEIAANILVAGSILLAGRNNVHTWWMGIVGCALFSLVFQRSHLYADMVLQFFFIIVSVFGWWQWLRGDHGEPLPITRVRPRAWLWLVPLAVAGTFAYGGMLHTLTNAYAPFVDSGVLVLSVIAQLLMMRRKLESWWVWLLVNTIAVPLYYSRGLHLTSILYIGFWINALVAARHWRTLMRRESDAANAVERAADA